MENFTYEKIGNNIEVCTSPEHTFGTDAFLLADFAAPKRKDLAIDLGTGCGIIPLLWLREGVPKKAVGLDIQQLAIQQLTKSIEKSQLEDKLYPLLADIKEIRDCFPAGEFDLVTCNPPYSTPDSGVHSPTDSRQIARHETLCTIDDICKSAAWLLRFGGRFCLCQLPERLIDVLSAMRANGIEPKRIRFVQNEYNTAPWLFLVEGKRGSKPFLTIDPPLIMRDNGNATEEINRIYRLYGKV